MSLWEELTEALEQQALLFVRYLAWVQLPKPTLHGLSVSEKVQPRDTGERKLL